MGGGVSVPGPSQEERDLQRNQAELLKLQRQIIEDQRSQNAILIPFFAEQEGFQVETDDEGNITSISRVPTELEGLQEELELGLTQRSLAALKGELPVSPGLERDLANQEETLRERLGQQLGPGYETSSPGIESLEEFRTTAEVLREGARTAQLTLAEQLGIARTEANRDMELSQMNVLRQFGTGDPLSFAGAFGQTAQGFGQAQIPFIRQRELQTNAAIANQQSRASMFGAGIGLVGSLFCDERLKTNIIDLGTEFVPGVPLTEFQYKGEVKHEGINAPTYIGVTAEDVERAGYKEAVVLIEGYKAVDFDLLKALGNKRSLENQYNGIPQRTEYAPKIRTQMSYAPKPMFDDNDQYEEWVPASKAGFESELPPMLRGL